MKYNKLIIIFFISFLFLLLFGNYSSPLNPYFRGDSAIFRTMGLNWLEGGIPFRDLFDQKGPYLYLFQTIGLYISKSKWGIFILQTINLTITLYLLFSIGSCFTKRKKYLWGSVLLTLIFFTATISEGNMCEEWSLPFCILPLLYLTQYYNDKKIPRYKVMIMGACFGLLSFLRINNAIINCSVIGTFFITFLSNKKYKELAISIMTFIIGILISTVPILLYFYKNNGLYELLHCTFLYNLKYKELWMDITPKLICKNLSFIIPLLTLQNIVLYKFAKHPKDGYIVFSTLNTAITIFVFYKSWAFNHYFTILLPNIYLIIILIFITIERKIYKFLFILIAFLPFSENSIRCVGKNIILNIIYKNDFLYSKTGNIEGVTPRELNRTFDEILSIIPDKDKNSIYCYNSYPNQSFFAYSNIIPVGKYFFYQDKCAEVDEYIRFDIIKKYKEANPKYIMTDTYKGESKILDSFLINYRLIYSKDTKTFPIFIYKRLNINKE